MNCNTCCLQNTMSSKDKMEEESGNGDLDSGYVTGSARKRARLVRSGSRVGNEPGQGTHACKRAAVLCARVSGGFSCWFRAVPFGSDL